MSRPALLIVDVQNDFCPGGSLAVSGGDQVVPVLNQYVARFLRACLPVYASRDWHPERTSHFKMFGGLWPPHCVAGTPGARFHPDLRLPGDAIIVSKGTGPDEDAYSAFQARGEQGTSLADSLRQRGIRGLYVGGLTTDYCVRTTVLDAIGEGFSVGLLTDAVRGVEVNPGDSARALQEMLQHGARPVTLETIDQELGGWVTGGPEERV